MTRWIPLVALLMISVPSCADTVRIQWVSLLDVHGLWGGVNVYVNEEGYVFAQIVERSRVEKRYSGQMKPANIPVFEQMLKETDFVNIKIPARPGVPDEGKPQIRVLSKDGDQYIVEKWDNDKHAGFEQIYLWLKQRADTLKTGKPEYDGPYNPKWRPPGFK